MIGAEVGIGLHRRAVGMEGEDVGGRGPGAVIPRVTMDAVQLGLQVAVPQAPQIRQQAVPGRLSGGSEAQPLQATLIERDHALAGAEGCDDLREIAGQRPLPAKRVDATGEARADQFLETVDALGAGGGECGGHQGSH